MFAFRLRVFFVGAVAARVVRMRVRSSEAGDQP